MSLLEDVFLEDEAGEAQDLERVIEGDELDERPRTPDSNEASEKEDEAEEDRRVVDHTAKAKRVVKNPRFVLNPVRLMGPRGIQVIPEHFKDFKFKGKGHEREDIDLILKKLEHWAYRLYPKFKFDDCLKKIETLGRKRPVMVHLHKIRTDQYLSEEIVQQQDSSGDEAAADPPEEDEFDRLLQQQIELARSTPAPDSARKEINTPMSHHRSPLMVPKVSSSPSINDEQKERMIRNRKLAEERRLARLNQSNKSVQNINTSTEVPEKQVELNKDKSVNDTENTGIVKDNERVTNHVDKNEPIVRTHNRSNVIDSDSSDDENDVAAVNESVSVDVHNLVVNNADISNEDTPETMGERNMETVAVDATVINHDVTEGMPVVKKQSKTNTIESDSSDDENDVVAVNESVSVDVHNSVVNNANTCEDTPEIMGEINMETIANDTKVISDDVTEGMPVVKKQSKTNTIESDSSDEEGVLKINESVTVNIKDRIQRDANTEKYNPDNENVTENMALELGENVSIDNNKSCTNNEPETEVTKINLPDDSDDNETSNSEMAGETNSVLKDVTLVDAANQKVNENIDSVSVTEELMDVDFSDDF